MSDYTFTKRHIEGKITSAAKFEVMRKRNDPIIETGIKDLPPLFGDGFRKLHRTLKMPVILGVDVLTASETIFRRARNIRITRTLLPMRHSLLTRTNSKAFQKPLTMLRGSRTKPDMYILEMEERMQEIF